MARFGVVRAIVVSVASALVCAEGYAPLPDESRRPASRSPEVEATLPAGRSFARMGGFRSFRLLDVVTWESSSEAFLPPPPSFGPPAPLNANAALDLGRDAMPQLATNGLGTWVAVWQSDETLGGTIGSDLDILFASSTDEGASWSDPLPLAANAATDSGADEAPRIVYGGLHWIAVWQSMDTLGGSIGGDADILVALSDDGLAWSAPVPLNANAPLDTGSDLAPALASNGAGGWVAAWSSSDPLDGTLGTDLDILTARSVDDGVSWSDPLPLNTNAAADSGGDTTVELAADANDWVAVWSSFDSLGGTIGDDGDILFARSDDGGASWTEPLPLDEGATQDESLDGAPRLATDGGGLWVALWRRLDVGIDEVLAVRSSDGGPWSAPEEIGQGEGGGPTALASDGADWLAVWMITDPVGGDRDLRVVRSTDGGQGWSDPAALNANAGFDDGSDYEGQLAADAQGLWLATWSSTSSLQGTIDADRDILFATWRVPEPGAWALWLAALAGVAGLSRSRTARQANPGIPAGMRKPREGLR